MKGSFSVLAACVVIVSVCGCTSQPVMNLQAYSVPSLDDGSPPPMETVKSAILMACRMRGWTPKVVDEGLIQAEIMVRTKHHAVIEIPFTSTEYSILYKDSQGLDYKKNGHIHRNYNRWIVMLSQTIQREIGVSSQRF